MQTALNSSFTHTGHIQDAAHLERCSPRTGYMICRITLGVCFLAAIAFYASGLGTGLTRDMFISICSLGVASTFYMIFLSTWSRRQWRWRWIAIVGFPATSIALILIITGIWLVNPGIWDYPRGIHMTGDAVTAMMVAGAAALMSLLLRARLKPPWFPLVRWTCISVVALAWMMSHEANHAWIVGPKDSLVRHLIPGLALVVGMGTILVCLLHGAFVWNRQIFARTS